MTERYTSDDAEVSGLAEGLLELQTSVRAAEPDIGDGGGLTSPFTIPNGSQAALSPEASELLEALIDARPGTSDSDLRSRLIESIDDRLKVRRLRLGRVEPLLKASRASVSRTLDDLAASIEVEVEVLQTIEDGTRPIGPEDMEVLARWISELEEDEGEAIAALQRSYRPPASANRTPAYTGANDTTALTAGEFADKVRQRILEIRSLGGWSSPET